MFVLGVAACAAVIGCTQILEPAGRASRLAAGLEWPVPAEAGRPHTERGLAPRADLVDVAVPRELRGLWVATVSNLDFPSRAGLPAEQQRAELDTLVDTAADLGLNALVFQVRPEADAFYDSPLEPWSRFLTGRQGDNPGFDPLAYLVEAAHARSLEVHAWFNPYRAATSRKTTLADAHLARRAVSSVRAWGSLLWLDPGVPEIRDHTVAVVSDVLDRYDVDGIHLDDYFYPYPERGRTFPDEATYRTYLAAGGQLERDAWRRGNVDSLIQGLASQVHTKRPDVRFGVSPFGIYRPGSPEGVRGLDQVATLHADPLAWYAHGWVDYLAPQLYWTTTKEPQRFDRLLTWWNDQVVQERPLLVGLDLTKVGTDPAWTLDELRAQVTLSRAADTTAGHLWFRASPVLADTGHLRSLFRDLYADPALPPPLARGAATEVAPPTVQVTGDTVALASATDLRAYVLYRSTPEGWQADQILSADTTSLTPGEGTWAISAVDRRGVESRAVRCELTADG